MTDFVGVHRPCLLAVLLLAAAPVFAQSARPNDTGQITCYNATAATGTVSPATPDPEQPGFNGQDCTQGRSAADALGTLVKIGASTVPGRDYTKIANDGSELPASATLGTGATDWGCTRDNLTGLIWEMKLDNASDRRHYLHTYNWFNSDFNINGGNPGTVGTPATCNNTLDGFACNTINYLTAINALTGANRLCGAADWRLPTGKELQSLVHYGAAAAPFIDATWFPNAVASGNASVFWSGQNYSANASVAWRVVFNNGYVNPDFKSNDYAVRLVRGGQ